MTIRQVGKVLSPLVLLALSLSFGCAQQMQSLQTDPVAGGVSAPQIQSVTLADDASKVVIVAEAPIVYTYYQLESPPRVIVDIAQTAPGKQAFPIIVGKGLIEQIDISRHEFGSGVLSRIDIALNSKAEVTAALDQQDKRKLTIFIPTTPVGEQAPAAAEAAAPEVAATAAPAVAEKAAPEVAETTTPAVAETVAPPTPSVTVATENQPAGSDAQATLESASPVPGKQVAGRALTAITTVAAGVQLITSVEPDSYKAFKLTQPDRLVIDIFQTRNAMAAKVVDVNAFNIGKARVGAAQDKLRVVFDATGIIPSYNVTKNQSGLLIAFDTTAKTEAPSAGSQNLVQTDVAAAKAAYEAEKAQPVKAAANKDLPGVVEALEFTQTDGISRLTVRTSGSCTAGEPVKNVKGYSLTLKDCRLPVKLQRQLDTSGFDSAIESIAPYSVSGRTAPETRIAVNLSSTLPNNLRTEANLIHWDFKEPVKAAKPAPRKSIPVDSLDRDMDSALLEQPKSRVEKPVEDAFILEKASQSSSRPGKVYTGRKVTLEFSDADIKKIFQLLAEVSNQNILVSDDVTGTISLKLVNVPWDQALDVILENKGLGMLKEGNIVQIRPKTKMKSLDEEAVEMRLVEERKMPLSTVIFDVNYSSLSEIETQFKNLKSKRPDTSISSDVRTNKIIVVDIDPNISKMRKLLEQLDVPEKQVMIEARIVEATSTFARDIGVQWGFGYTDGSASIANINSATGSMGGVVSSILPTATTGGVAAGVAFGKLLSNIQLDMRLSAAASIGQIKIVSTPKVMTVNNKPAKISQGQMIPYQNTSSQDGAKTEFIEAALSLQVTPHITADGSVSMKIKASNDSAGVGSPPPINKKEAATELVVRNGETTVIGGIYVDSETDGSTGVPYLSDIPLLGNLFKSNSKNKNKNEMLIFITPRIIN